MSDFDWVGLGFLFGSAGMVLAVTLVTRPKNKSSDAEWNDILRATGDLPDAD